MWWHVSESIIVYEDWNPHATTEHCGRSYIAEQALAMAEVFVWIGVLFCFSTTWARQWTAIPQGVRCISHAAILKVFGLYQKSWEPDCDVVLLELLHQVMR